MIPEKILLVGHIGIGMSGKILHDMALLGYHDVVVISPDEIEMGIERGIEINQPPPIPLPTYELQPMPKFVDHTFYKEKPNYITGKKLPRKKKK